MARHGPLPPPDISDGAVVCPHYIFIKCDGCYSDQEVLDLLGLAQYQKQDPGQGLWHYLWITEDSAGWTHMGEGWSYHLFNTYRSELKQKLLELSDKHDVYHCSMGDADRSYDFHYMQRGKVIRSYVMNSPGWNDRVLGKDLGDPLPGEAGLNLFEDEERHIILSIARAQGIQLHHDSASIRFYGTPRPKDQPVPTASKTRAWQNVKRWWSK